MTKNTWIIAGLGNPGSKYENTPHNVGFMVIDKIVAQNTGSYKTQSNAQVCKINKFIGDNDVILVKPQSFMNLSGDPVRNIMNYYKVNLQNIIIVHDDIDLDFGRIKLKYSGGSGGHNGIRSIDANLKTSDYYRIRIGVGRGGGNPSNYVLSKMNSADLGDLQNIIEQAINACGLIISEGLEKAQCAIH